MIEIVAANSDKIMSTHRLSNKSANLPIGICAINPPNKNTVIRIAISAFINPIAFPYKGATILIEDPVKPATTTAEKANGESLNDDITLNLGDFGISGTTLVVKVRGNKQRQKKTAIKL